MIEDRHGYDVIVVGARCAGSPTAMLLARKGYRVLVVDKTTFPSNTVSTHLLHPPGVAALKRWGLLDSLIATACPPVHTYSFDFGRLTLEGSPGTDEAPVAYAPRRTLLDKLLVDAASEAGAEVREGFTVEEVLIEKGRVEGVRGRDRDGRTSIERAPMVVGADGRYSTVAKTVGPEQYNEKPRLLAAYFSYFRGLPMEGRSENYVRPNRGFAAWPTNDDLTVAIAVWPYAESAAIKGDIEGHFRRIVSLAPQFAERVATATRVEPFVGAAVVNYLRKPFGPGWALVGDAGYNKDFITGQGMHDAFRDADLCATAVDDVMSGRSEFNAAMEMYRSARDRQVLSMYEFTCQLATLQPPPPDVQRLLTAARGNQEAMDGFVRVTAGVTSPADFFSEQNVERVLAFARA